MPNKIRSLRPPETGCMHDSPKCRDGATATFHMEKAPHAHLKGHVDQLPRKSAVEENYALTDDGIKRTVAWGICWGFGGLCEPDQRVKFWEKFL